MLKSGSLELSSAEQQMSDVGLLGTKGRSPSFSGPWFPSTSREVSSCGFCTFLCDEEHWLPYVWLGKPQEAKQSPHWGGLAHLREGGTGPGKRPPPKKHIVLSSPRSCLESSSHAMLCLFLSWSLVRRRSFS